MKDLAQGPFAFLGRSITDASVALGKTAVMLRLVVFWLWHSKLEWRQTLIQCVRIGVDSLPVTVLTSYFTGMVLALQSGQTSKELFNEPLYVGTLVGFSMVKELGPVLTATVVSGRAGAAVTAEIGTMKVTEQIDALHTLGTDPIRYLAIPRFIAFMLMVPLLTAFANTGGILGGLTVATAKLGVPAPTYWDDILLFMRNEHYFHGFIKTVFFGLMIATVSCYKGLNTTGGAEGVGRATTSAVVVSMVSVLVLDYFLTAVLLVIGIG